MKCMCVKIALLESTVERIPSLSSCDISVKPIILLSVKSQIVKKMRIQMHQCLNFVSYLDDFRYCGKQKKKCNMRHIPHKRQLKTKRKQKIKNVLNRDTKVHFLSMALP